LKLTEHMKTFAALLALCGLTAAFSEKEYQNAFTGWMRKHHKSYAHDEFQTRYGVFRPNMDFIHAHNNDATKSFSVAMNQFGDLTNSEFVQYHTGLSVPEGYARSGDVQGPVDLSAAPASVNWVTKGAVTAIKNQGQCGSCWSFSTTGSTEGAHFLGTGKLVSLSEQDLIDCSVSYGNNGCGGGLMDDAFQYIIANKGIDTEASYPYTTSGPNACQYNAANCGATIKSYTDVTQGSESALQAAVVNAPVSVAIDAAQSSFQFYNTGVYYEPACSPTALDHGVLAVGYGNLAGQGDYWLVKNSWGTSWGENGYIMMARNRNNNCGIASMASFPTGGGNC